MSNGATRPAARGGDEGAGREPGRIRVGVSSCLLGEAVRYNGGHKRDRFVAEVLAEHFELVPYCPEVAIGLGVPRPALRLSGETGAPRALRTSDGHDVTGALDTYGREVAREAGMLSGYILKSRSPSCGMERVRVYHPVHGGPVGHGPGIFARALMRERPLLPMEEEGRLNDPVLRDNFIERVFVFNRWQRLLAGGLDPGTLVRFHTEHKFLAMAHAQADARALGRLVSRAGAEPLERVAGEYIARLMAVLERPARRSEHANVLMHMAGFLKEHLEAGDRAELREAIEAYRRDEASIVVPLTLLRHHVRRNPGTYLETQSYLERYPGTLNPRV